MEISRRERLRLNHWDIRNHPPRLKRCRKSPFFFGNPSMGHGFHMLTYVNLGSNLLLLFMLHVQLHLLLVQLAFAWRSGLIFHSNWDLCQMFIMIIMQLVTTSISKSFKSYDMILDDMISDHIMLYHINTMWKYVTIKSQKRQIWGQLSMEPVAYGSKICQNLYEITLW